MPFTPSNMSVSTTACWIEQIFCGYSCPLFDLKQPIILIQVALTWQIFPSFIRSGHTVQPEELWSTFMCPHRRNLVCCRPSWTHPLQSWSGQNVNCEHTGIVVIWLAYNVICRTFSFFLCFCLRSRSVSTSVHEMKTRPTSYSKLVQNKETK